MELFKKLALILFIILFFISIFKDLTVGTNVTTQSSNDKPSMEEEQNQDHTNQQESDSEKNNSDKQNERYDSVRIYPSAGDTVLSIVEELNPELSSVRMNEIIEDFQKLNPNANPHIIDPKTAYYFPVYHAID